MYNSDSKLRGKIKMILLTQNVCLCFYIAAVAGKALNTATNTTGPYNAITVVSFRQLLKNLLPQNSQASIKSLP